MSAQTSDEPNLEEILASIRRIISEDGPGHAAAALSSGAWPAASAESDDDVLVLTHRVPMNGHPFLHAEPEDAAPALLEAEPEVPAPVANDLHPTPKPEIEPVVAEDTESHAVAAFAKLEAASRPPERAPSILMPAPGRTLEDVVREMVQPLIKEWLDENLPEIVERRVDEEIERIARKRVR